MRREKRYYLEQSKANSHCSGISDIIGAIYKFEAVECVVSVKADSCNVAFSGALMV